MLFFLWELLLAPQISLYSQSFSLGQDLFSIPKGIRRYICYLFLRSIIKVLVIKSLHRMFIVCHNHVIDHLT